MFQLKPSLCIAILQNATLGITEWFWEAPIFIQLSRNPHYDILGSSESADKSGPFQHTAWWPTTDTTSKSHWSLCIEYWMNSINFLATLWKTKWYSFCWYLSTAGCRPFIYGWLGSVDFFYLSSSIHAMDWFNTIHSAIYRNGPIELGHIQLLLRIICRASSA